MAPVLGPRKPVVPFKANQDRRHHIPKQQHRVTNWREYDAALRRRGSLTVWFTDAAIATWGAERRTTPGGQRATPALAITMALTLRAVFRLALEAATTSETLRPTVMGERIIRTADLGEGWRPRRNGAGEAGFGRDAAEDVPRLVVQRIATPQHLRRPAG